MLVNGARLTYVEQGLGATVVFVHGGASDHRTWDRQCRALAGHYRTVAYTQRYFGTEPWGADWPPFSVQTHADDLTALILALGAGPVHLVAWSYGGHIALLVALNHPELVRSAFIFEPIVPSYVADPAEKREWEEDAARMFPPIWQAVQSGNNEEAVRCLIDAVAGRPGYFDALPPSARSMKLDSARVMPLLRTAPPAPPIRCEQLAQIAVPITIARGELVRPVHRLVADAAARCMPVGRHIIIPNAGHMWPSEDVAGFNEALMEFLRRM